LKAWLACSGTLRLHHHHYLRLRWQQQQWQHHDFQHPIPLQGLMQHCLSMQH